MTYVDKTVFYQCQFINCGVGIDMNATRGNNLDAWVDCLFDGNDVAMSASNANAFYVANSIFTNTQGDYVCSAPMNYYSCDFTNNATSTLFDSGVLFAEGCNFNDNMAFNSPRIHRPGQYYLWNNTINNTFDLNKIGKGFLMNNNFTTNSSLNKQMIEVIDGSTLTILEEESNPYPQLLVKQLSVDDCQFGCEQEPFTVPFNIPGKVEAEDYDKGGQGISFNDDEETNLGEEYRTDGVDIQVTTDTDGGYNVSYIRADEWLEYIVNVEKTDEYDIKVRVASELGGGFYRLEMDGEIIVNTTEVNETGGWQTFADINTNNVLLDSGEHVLRFYAVAGGFNMNWINFTTSEITNIENSSETSAINLYPNPAKDLINISGAEGGSYELLDQSGRVYKSGGINSKLHSINTNDLSEGLYMIKVVRKGGVVLDKIVIAH